MCEGVIGWKKKVTREKGEKEMKDRLIDLTYELLQEKGKRKMREMIVFSFCKKNPCN